MFKKNVLVVLSIMLLFTVTGCGKQVFNGNRISNDTEFIMDYSILNRTESHQMRLNEGTNIDTIIENKSGRLDILIKSENGKQIYVGNNAASGNFTIKIPETDTYIFSITGNNAKGSVSFKVAD